MAGHETAEQEKNENGNVNLSTDKDLNRHSFTWFQKTSELHKQLHSMAACLLNDNTCGTIYRVCGGKNTKKEKIYNRKYILGI